MSCEELKRKIEELNEEKVNNPENFGPEKENLLIQLQNQYQTQCVSNNDTGNSEDEEYYYENDNDDYGYDYYYDNNNPEIQEKGFFASLWNTLFGQDNNNKEENNEDSKNNLLESDDTFGGYDGGDSGGDSGD